MQEFKAVLDQHYEARFNTVTEEVENENEYWSELQFLTVKKEEVWKFISPELYTIFWYLNLQSLVVPDDIYKEQIKKIPI